MDKPAEEDEHDHHGHAQRICHRKDVAMPTSEVRV
jgi:hypothetical protein